MSKLRNIFPFIAGMLMFSVNYSCTETPSTHEVRLLDSLNQRSYDMRYKRLDISYKEALLAYNKADLYDQGKAEACNNLGFCAFMRMDFDTAEKYYKKVHDITQNELELVIADIGLMKIYQRTSMNKEYYDCRNSAVRRMKRIDEDQSVFVDVHEKKRLNYARSEFFIVSSIYYYYLQQEQEAIQSVNQIGDSDLVGDTAQTLYYYYIKGSAELFEKNNVQQKSISAFDELFNCWMLSRNNYIYFEANSIQGISSLLNNKTSFNQIYYERPRAIQDLNNFYHFQKSEITASDTVLSLNLAQKALQKFKKYKDIYQIAGTYVSIGKYYNIHGHYKQALDSLGKALDCVNQHHRLYYDAGKEVGHKLKLSSEQDTIYTELTWIAKDNIKTVPEWIARIREQLSVSYAGLGLKVPSNYNRNIYLDILDYTRQDKQLESRSQELEKEDRQLNVLSLIVFTGIVLLIALFWVLNSRSKIRNRKHTQKLRTTLEVCQRITASIPVDVRSTDEIISAVGIAIQADLKQLFRAHFLRIGIFDKETGEFIYPSIEEDETIENELVGDNFIKSPFNLYLPEEESPVGVIELYTRHKMTKDEKALMNVIAPYIAWTLGNGLTFISLGDERIRLEKQRYVYEQHIADNKRQNLIKKACMAIVYGITPYMDRIINEVNKLTTRGFLKDETIKYEKYQYIDELVTKINEYNDILALWIKMKQGSLNLNIENFELNELFELLAKGRKTFEMKQQTFNVEPTNATVKADKALTLFMINTLTENARKYTPKGGTINVSAKAEEDYVEISVQDTGRGISAEDVARILGEKVYDSSQIGMEATDKEELFKNKGSGFGLINCKGIIEKYRKTNDLFKVCKFSIESIPGNGSRFYFRLPTGVRKILGILACVLLTTGFSSCGKPVKPALKDSRSKENVSSQYRKDYDKLLNEASLYADTVYYCNVIENYPLALQYADSAITRLNKHYAKYTRDPRYFMTLKGQGTSAEINWWNGMFNSDYYVILDIRNEAAVAFLALKQWDNYQYNNTAYSRLYKLVSEDYSLEEYCRNLEHSTNNKVVAVILCILLLIIFFIGYYLLFIRKRLINRWNLEQVLEINKQVLASSSTLQNIPRHIVDNCFDGINELLTIDMLSIGVYNEDSHKMEFAYNPHQLEWNDTSVEIQGEQETLTEVMQRCFNTQIYTTGKLKSLPFYNNDLYDMYVQALPLMVEVGETHRCVGVLAFLKQEDSEQENERLLIELITNYVAIVVFNAVVKLATKYRDIESAEEDTHRASWEDSLLHVQNMVLDNCLSTIKHETIYYPSKIKNIIDKLAKQQHTPAEENEHIETISELIDYYKGIFTILSSCAARQLEEVTFRRGIVETDDLLAYAQKYFTKMSKRMQSPVRFRTEGSDMKVIGDVIQLRFLFENLIDECLSVAEEGEVILEAKADGEFVRFLFTDRRREKTVEELNQLFYPDLARMTASEEGKLKGTEYLICKQIIRDHDEFAGQRGCRINAEPSPEGGFTVYFTLPKKREGLGKTKNNVLN
jgi:K+-sensing histidine kinase KdpD/preprotein translocase subunit YajC